jgi:hypothetical protein
MQYLGVPRNRCKLLNLVTASVDYGKNLSEKCG